MKVSLSVVAHVCLFAALPLLALETKHTDQLVRVGKAALAVASLGSVVSIADTIIDPKAGNLPPVMYASAGALLYTSYNFAKDAFTLKKQASKEDQKAQALPRNKAQLLTAATGKGALAATSFIGSLQTAAFLRNNDLLNWKANALTRTRLLSASLAGGTAALFYCAYNLAIASKKALKQALAKEQNIEKNKEE